MKLEKQVCALDFSKEIASFGIKFDSLWWHHLGLDGETWHISQKQRGMPWVDNNVECYPAWTCAELGEMLRVVLAKHSNLTMPEYNNEGFWFFKRAEKSSEVVVVPVNEVDARAEMLLYCLSHNLITEVDYDKQ